MKNIFIKISIVIVFVAFVVTSFSGCEKAKEADYTSTTIETTVIETEDTITTNGNINDLGPYIILEKETVNKLGDLYKDNKDVFIRTADLMLSQEVDTNVVYDFDKHSIAYVVVFTDIPGHHVNADNIFSDSERELLLSCLKIMAGIAPKDTRGISIWRTTSSISYPLGVDFMFRSKLNMDYGFIYTEYPFSDYKENIDDNWYTYMYGLV